MALERLARDGFLLPKRARGRSNLVCRLTLHAKCHDERRYLRARGRSTEDRVHCGLDVARRQVTAGDELFDRIRDHDAIPAENEDSQLRIRSWPCSVRNDSGWN